MQDHFDERSTSLFRSLLERTAERDEAVAERDRLRPVVEAAEAWREAQVPADRHGANAWAYGPLENSLIAVVDAYRASTSTPDAEPSSGVPVDTEEGRDA